MYFQSKILKVIGSSILYGFIIEQTIFSIPQFPAITYWIIRYGWFYYIAILDWNISRLEFFIRFTKINWKNIFHKKYHLKKTFNRGDTKYHGGLRSRELCQAPVMQALLSHLRVCKSELSSWNNFFQSCRGRVWTADLQTRRLALNPLLHGGLNKSRLWLETWGGADR